MPRITSGKAAGFGFQLFQLFKNRLGMTDEHLADRGGLHPLGVTQEQRATDQCFHIAKDTRRRRLRHRHHVRGLLQLAGFGHPQEQLQLVRF